MHLGHKPGEILQADWAGDTMGLVDAEWSTRKSNEHHKLIRNAGYSAPGAAMEEISYAPESQLDKEQLLRLATCSYIEKSQNIIILVAIGVGRATGDRSQP